MQFQLSTLFLVIFMVAASLALLGYCEDQDFAVFLGFVLLFFNATVLLAAVCVNRTRHLSLGVPSAMLILFFGVICSGLLLPAYSKAGNAAHRAMCVNNLKQIGLGLHNYHDAYGRFPPACIRDKHATPLYSWRVDFLPMFEYANIYDSLNRDEPRNSPQNAKVLNKSLPELICRSDNNWKDQSTNYVAIIGPGTAWRADGQVKLSDLPDRGSHTVAVVEVFDSGVHWAEPRDLTVDEALEGLRTGKGLRISSAHPGVINVLFADGTVRSLPSKMPISVWAKLFAGEIQDLDNIDRYIDASAPDMVDVSVYGSPRTPGKWLLILSIAVWLFSVVLLFRRAIKSRPQPMKAEIADGAFG
jgi:prepilin-type processing-associated H-X9-DG protein